MKSKIITALLILILLANIIWCISSSNVEGITLSICALFAIFLSP